MVVKTKKGYTLVELLVAMGIMVILIGIGIFSFLAYDRQNALTLSAEQIRSFLNKNVLQAQSSTTDLGVSSVSTATVLEYNEVSRALEIKKIDINGEQIQNGKVYDSYEIPENISIATKFISTTGPSTQLIFKSPSGEITNKASSIELSTNNYTATVKISSNEVTIEKNY